MTIGGSELSTVTDPCSDQGLIKPCPRTLWDTGTVTINVNGVAKTVSYASASTPTSIGSSFVTAYAGDPTVTVTSSGATITLVSIATGTAANYFVIRIVHHQRSNRLCSWIIHGHSFQGVTDRWH